MALSKEQKLLKKVKNELLPVTCNLLKNATQLRADRNAAGTPTPFLDSQLEKAMKTIAKFQNLTLEK